MRDPWPGVIDFAAVLGPPPVALGRTARLHGRDVGGQVAEDLGRRFDKHSVYLAVIALALGCGDAIPWGRRVVMSSTTVMFSFNRGAFTYFNAVPRARRATCMRCSGIGTPRSHEIRQRVNSTSRRDCHFTNAMEYRLGPVVGRQPDRIELVSTVSPGTVIQNSTSSRPPRHTPVQLLKRRPGRRLPRAAVRRSWNALVCSNAQPLEHVGDPNAALVRWVIRVGIWTDAIVDR